MTVRPIRRALLSVYDKTGLVELARDLAARDVVLVSTGGTARALREAGLAVVDVAEVTGAPEILDGRVKTLHPSIHGGLLARRDLQAHAATLSQSGIAAIDLLVSNLYPFERARRDGRSADELIEEIDVGGPAMTRAAAKNHEGVAVLTDPSQYALLMHELERHGGTTQELRRRLAAAAFARTAAYDATIAEWLTGEIGDLEPERVTVTATRRQSLRYGENPHQRAAFYLREPARAGVATARQLQGKELSFNNILDTDAAFELVAEFEEPAVAIIKHTNPCGVAVANTLEEAYRKTLACDPVSAFGGIVALNGSLDEATARAVSELFTEVVIAPDVSAEAAEVFAAKKNLRLLVADGMPAPGHGERQVRSVAGGFLVQDADVGRIEPAELEVVTTRAPGEEELADLLLAWKVVKHVKSNAIVLARGGATVGIGMGQTNRLDSVRIAAERMAAGPGAGRCVCASDAFFPFADGLTSAVRAGATAVIQPGGSVRDPEVIDAANEADVAMVFTRMRHFRH